MSVTIRAKSIIKINTGQSNLTYEYAKGTDPQEIARDMIHAVVFNTGTEDARILLNDWLDKYKPEFKGGMK